MSRRAKLRPPVYGNELSMKSEAFLTARNDLSELGRLNQFLSRFLAENRLPEDLALDTGVALEEVFANVVMHGYRDQAAHEILVRLAVEAGEVIVTVEDDGVAFNPLESPPVDTGLELKERPVGGLGIHLVRSLMSEVEYARQNGRNRLEMRKQIPRTD
jgi:serine/threonine-protein kinase RsbW